MKMILNIYSIFDSATKSYNTPFFMQNDELAIRALKNLVNDDSTDVCKFPDQFILFKLGEFNDSTGFINNDDCPQRVTQAIQHKEVSRTTDSLDNLFNEVKNLKDLIKEILK